MALWLVRSGRNGEREDLALDRSVAVHGNQELKDLSNVQSRKDLQALFDQTFHDQKPKTRINWAGQLWTFIKEISVDDLVAMPLKGRPVIAIGRVVGSYKYHSDFPTGAQHTLPVKWLKEIPRTDFDLDLRYSLGAFMTVCQIQRNNAEKRVRAMVEGGKPGPRPSEEDAELAAGEARPDLEKVALDEIRDFITRRFKGHGLARLGAAVLEAQGFKVHISPEGVDGGVDIIAGQGVLGFDAPRIVVQVKSEDGPVDVKVLRELQGVVTKFGANHGLLIAWGGFKSTVRKEAAQSFFSLRLWDSADLVKMIQDNYLKLSEDIQAELPLKRTWSLIAEGE